MSSPVPGLAGARLWAAARFPYLATGIFATQVTAAPGSSSVAVDEQWRLRADPDLAAQWVEKARVHVGSLPPKAKKPRKA